MRRAALGLAWAVSLIATSAGAVPPAADARSRAAESFREAQAAFERRDFAAAAAAFEAAAGFAPHPAALLSAADAWDRAGEPARAAEDCDRAASLASAGEAAAADHVDYAHDAAQCLERLRARTAVIDVRGAGALAARVDDGPERVLPVRIWVRPGHHVLAVIDLTTSQTRREDLDLSPGQERRMDLAPPAPPLSSAPPLTPAPTLTPAPAPSADERRHPVPAAAWTAFALGGAAAITYAVSGVLTVSARNTFDATPTADTRSAFYRDRTIADASFGAAVAALATGLVLWLVAPATTEHASLRPAVVRF